MSGQRRTEYRDPTYWRWYVVGMTFLFGLAGALIAVAALSLGERPFAMIVAAFVTLAFVVSWRSRRLGTLSVDAHGITEYRPLRTRVWRWEDVERVSVDVRILPFKVVESRVLALRLADGRDVALDTVVASPRKGEGSWVDAAAREINQRLAITRAPGW